jgi:hypothetical protein
MEILINNDGSVTVSDDLISEFPELSVVVSDGKVIVSGVWHDEFVRVAGKNVFYSTSAKFKSYSVVFSSYSGDGVYSKVDDMIVRYMANSNRELKLYAPIREVAIRNLCMPAQNGVIVEYSGLLESYLDGKITKREIARVLGLAFSEIGTFSRESGTVTQCPEYGYDDIIYMALKSVTDEEISQFLKSDINAIDLIRIALSEKGENTYSILAASSGELGKISVSKNGVTSIDIHTSSDIKWDDIKDIDFKTVPSIPFNIYKLIPKDERLKIPGKLYENQLGNMYKLPPEERRLAGAVTITTNCGHEVILETDRYNNKTYNVYVAESIANTDILAEMLKVYSDECDMKQMTFIIHFIDGGGNECETLSPFIQYLDNRAIVYNGCKYRMDAVLDRAIQLGLKYNQFTASVSNINYIHIPHAIKPSVFEFCNYRDALATNWDEYDFVSAVYAYARGTMYRNNELFLDFETIPLAYTKLGRISDYLCYGCEGQTLRVGDVKVAVEAAIKNNIKNLDVGENIIVDGEVQALSTTTLVEGACMAGIKHFNALDPAVSFAIPRHYDYTVSRATVDKNRYYEIFFDTRILATPSGESLENGVLASDISYNSFLVDEENTDGIYLDRIFSEVYVNGHPILDKCGEGLTYNSDKINKIIKSDDDFNITSSLPIRKADINIIKKALNLMREAYFHNIRVGGYGHDKMDDANSKYPLRNLTTIGINMFCGVHGGIVKLARGESFTVGCIGISDRGGSGDGTLVYYGFEASTVLHFSLDGITHEPTIIETVPQYTPRVVIDGESYSMDDYNHSDKEVYIEKDGPIIRCAIKLKNECEYGGCRGYVWTLNTKAMVYVFKITDFPRDGELKDFLLGDVSVEPPDEDGDGITVEYSITESDGEIVVSYVARDKDGKDVTDTFYTMTIGDKFLHKEFSNE